MAHVATVTIDSDQVPADATNFPAYINLAHLFAGSESFASTVANGGGDIRVFQGATELAREVVSCDTSAETGELHVLIPFLDSSADTVISIYADGSSADYAVDDPFGRNAVWGDYALVMHLGEADGSLSDSTGGGGPYSVTSTGNGTGTAQQTGKMGLGYDFSGGQIVTDTPATGTAAFTMSAWGAFSGARGNEQTIVASWSSSQHVLFRINPDLTLEGFVDDGSQKGGTFAGSATADTLTHTVMRLDSGTLSGAFNASWSATTFTGIGTLNTGGNDYRIGGRAADLNEFMDGVLDEVRVRHTALSANWITTEYNNQSDPSSFYTVTDPNAGGSESISPDSLYQSVSIEGVTLTQAHVLAAANLAQLQAIGAATLAQANSIAPHGVDQTAGIESATLTQAHIIAPAGISQHQQIGTASLVSAGVLSVFGLAQTQTLDEAILTVAGALDVDGVSQSQVLEALTLVQNNILAPAGLAQEAALEATTINAAALGITPAGIEQVMAIDPTGLTQYHVLAVSDLAQDQILEAARFGGLVIGELQGRIYVFAALDGDVYAIPALTGTIH
jgi:hypothetical protein